MAVETYQYDQISIHALREEGDPCSRFRPCSCSRFLSTPSARRATSFSTIPHPMPYDFYPRPPRGGRPTVRLTIRPPSFYFYPRPPRGGRPVFWYRLRSVLEFLSTPSARRATSSTMRVQLIFEDFYPRPPRGGRRVWHCPDCNHRVFLSTPSARRATYEDRLDITITCQFLSTPSARRATGSRRGNCRAAKISIHALREEGDYEAPQSWCYVEISIHALREEGDRCWILPFSISSQISIHALREEGDGGL